MVDVPSERESGAHGERPGTDGSPDIDGRRTEPQRVINIDPTECKSGARFDKPRQLTIDDTGDAEPEDRFPDGSLHDARCRNARLPICVCRCHGLFHGKTVVLNDAMGERLLTEAMGGEVATMLRNYRGLVIPQDAFCPHAIGLDLFLGYPHDGGLADANGERWWAYARCPVCSYEVSWWKIDRVLQRQAALAGA